MTTLIEYPALVFLASFALLSVSIRWGKLLFDKRGGLDADIREDFGTILAATLTMLALLIGFCFSMAINRYDQRKNCEAAEAIAIATEVLRADLLTADDAAKVRPLLKRYLDQRLQFYATRDAQELQRIGTRTSELRSALWSAVTAARTQPTPTLALAISGMNDVLNSEWYTQAAWWNRIPIAAWLLLIAIASCSSVLIGYGARKFKAERYLLLVIPLVVATAFFLIADIDSPRGGIIRVSPHNLERLANSWGAM